MRILVTDQNFGDGAEIERRLVQAAGGELVLEDCKSEADVAEALERHRPDALLVQFAPIGERALRDANGLAGIVRYGHEIFFLALNLEMGRGFINCMWMDASKLGNIPQRRSATKSVFQVIKSYGGDEAVAHSILVFGTRGAILDFAGWTDVVRKTMQSNWNNNYWFYTFPTGDGTTTFSPPAKQIPHHQGRNIIPIKVASGATSVTVEFTPDAAGSKGTKQLMQAQLVYRDSADKPVYGTMFTSGMNTIQIPNGARNGIVNFVVAVTNPNADSGGDDGSNKGFDGQERFNYKARIVSGGKIAPTSTRPW